MKKLKYFITDYRKEPFMEWRNSLSPGHQFKIDSYLKRIAMGGSRKNIKPIGAGTFELKIDSGPGFRVYFGEYGKSELIILLGGIKKTQKEDIKTATKYWKQYETNKKL